MVGLPLVLAPALAAPANKINMACGESSTARLVIGETLRIRVEPSGQVRDLVITEKGTDLWVSVDGAPRRELAYPMVSSAWMRIRIQPQMPAELSIGLVNADQGSVEIASDCELASDGKMQWLARAYDLAPIRASVTTHQGSIPDLLALLKDAPSSEERAGATHMLADQHSRDGDMDAAIAEYRHARAIWAELRKPVQQAGTWLGESDAWREKGNVSEGLKANEQARRLLDPERDAYLYLRTIANECLTHQYSGKLEQAVDCYSHLIAGQLARGEQSNAVNSAVNLSYALRDLGRTREAVEALDRLALDPDSDRVSPSMRLRFVINRAYLARDQGDLVDALEDFARALRLAEQVGESAASWQALAITQIADIYAQLGVTDQAYRLLADSFALYDPASAPARVAAGLMKMGLIDRNSGNLQRAAQWYASAERIYALLNMPVERSEAALGALESRPPDNAEDARRELAQVRDWSRLSATLNSRRALLTVRWQIAAGDRAGAEAALKTIEAQPAPLPQRLLAARIRAELQHQQGADAAALRTIEQQLAQVGALADRAGNAAISYLTVRAARELREDWVRIALTSHPQPAPDRWWQVLVQSAPMQAVRPGRKVQGTDFGAALARELLGDGKANADRALVDALAPAESAREERRPSELPALAAVRAGLGEDWLLLVVPAEPNSAALWMGPERTVIVPLPSRSVLREEIAQLSTDLASPDVPLARLQRSVSALSASLLSGAPLSQAPARLHVLGDDLIGTIPFALLRWPGSERALIDTTATGWITRVDAGSPGAGSGAGLRVVVAPGNQQTSQVGLAPLRYAAAEPDLIARTVPELSQQRALDGEATPAALVQALGDPDAWVHLAAHGYAQTQLLGYAGAWLADPSNPQGSVMLSWLDVINTPLRAPLAVLNACQLAAGPSATSQSSLSFASAVSAAGVDHVVAAYWPISDSASATWIPAFYSAMRAQPAAHAMDALRSAQLALKDSRSFRHPYYWASLAYFQHLRVGR